MQTTRRDLFKFAAGSAAGLVFTPVPWRLITDTALWSENWPGIPRPARGEIHTRFTNCALCPAGCAVRARCVGPQPVALTGLPGQPLCAFGLVGHHLPYHPGRVTQGALEQAAAAIAHRDPKASIAVLDLRPGRTASWTYRRAMAAIPHGLYLAPKRISPAVNLADAKTVLSFGAPLLEGWGTPASVFAARERFRLVQVEPVPSPTAALADLWLPIRAGSETALARAIAQLLRKQALPPEVAALTGIPEEQIVSVARQVAENGPALVVAAEEFPAMSELNRLLGSLGRTVFPRREAPVPESWTRAAAPVTTFASVADHSIGVLLIDESAPDTYLPWSVVQKKLVPYDPLVVTFASSRAGYGRHAQYLLPTAVYPEITSDLPPALHSAAATFRLAAPLVAPPAGVVDPPTFVARMARLPLTPALRERAGAIHQAGRGTVSTWRDGKSVPVRQVKFDDFWSALNEGGCWIDSQGPQAPAPQMESGSFADPPVEQSSLPLVVVTTAVPQPFSPLLSKLYGESNLRLSPGRIALHPETARQCGVTDGARAALETIRGRAAVQVSIDSGMPPGVVRVAATPALLDLCGPSARAKVVRV